jgi:hypothetical protein
MTTPDRIWTNLTEETDIVITPNEGEPVWAITDNDHGTAYYFLPQRNMIVCEYDDNPGTLYRVDPMAERIIPNALDTWRASKAE